MKVKSTAAPLVALAIALGSCGGDEEPSAERSAATGATQTQPPVTKQPSKERSKTTAGSGGAKQPKSDGDRTPAERDDSGASSGGQDAVERDEPRKKRSPAKKKAEAPAKTIEDLSPAQRKALHHDLYIQGKTLCSVYTPAQLAKDYNIQATEPEDVAREYAELYEQGNPSLVLPYQQGCLAGFKQRTKKDRVAGSGSGG